MLAFTFLYLAKAVLAPFVISFVLCYLLYPIIKRLNKIGFPKWLSVLITVFFFIVVIFSLGLLLIPSIILEINHLITSFPEYKIFFAEVLLPQIKSFLGRFDPIIAEKFENSFQELLAIIDKSYFVIFKEILKSGYNVFHALVVIFLIPIIIFFLLIDFDAIYSSFIDLVPKSSKKYFIRILSDIDFRLSEYLRGQFNVSVIMVVFYIAALTFVGLDYSLLAGLLAGLSTFVPVIGVVIGSLLSYFIAIIQFKSFIGFLKIVLIFSIGQFIEGNILTPRLVGAKIGSSALAIIFIILAFGAVFGIIGVIFAVPALAVFTVIAREFVALYKKSKLYQ